MLRKPQAILPSRSLLLALVMLFATALVWSGGAIAHQANESLLSDQGQFDSVEVGASDSEIHDSFDEHSAIGGHCHPSLECSLVFVLATNPPAGIPGAPFGSVYVKATVSFVALRESTDPPPPKFSALI